jgi:hypothetical protein
MHLPLMRPSDGLERILARFVPGRRDTGPQSISPYHPGNAVILANSAMLAQNKALLARIAERQAWQAAEDAGQLFAASVARSEGERRRADAGGGFAPDQQLEAMFADQTYWVHSVSISDDDRWLASGGGQSPSIAELHLWDDLTSKRH